MRYSVVIPVYNMQKYLRECIESIIMQNWDEYEVLLIDDGSTDDSGAIADAYASKYQYIKSYHFDNGGSVLARKRGAQLAKGEYIIYIDADDYLMNEYIKTVDDIVEKNGHPDMIVLGFSRSDANGVPSSISFYNNVPEGVYTGEKRKLIVDRYIYDKSLKGMNYGSIHFSVCTKIIKRELYIRCQGFVADRISYGDDMVLTKYILNDRTCKTIVVQDYNGYVYRDNENSMTNSISINSLQKYEYVIIELSKTERKYDNRICVHALRALFSVISIISQDSRTYSSYIGQVKESKKYSVLWSYAKRAIVFKPSIKDLLKIMIIRLHLYSLLYLYSKFQKNSK